ncbi:NAD(P)/FAD-dependent oxidoreductase [Sorangium sp. So ce854]|uniref:FAD-dependent oxidoreductase n=1 Tax=Sorangium cellulosum TaxID=56 RepID=A0A150PA41_SORCE|nr:FAD-dependent oxidoreductase [Sorangium cellulosum]
MQHRDDKANGKSNHFDVIILGSGMSGTQMGAILARQNFRVLIVEESSHPRFTIGESSIPETSLMNRIIADRYGVPEIKTITSFYTTSKKVASSTGIKRNFGFVFHKPGQEHDPKEFTQCIIPELPWGPESHFFRQDVDAYLLNAAIRYGCTVRQRTTIATYEADSAGVAVTTSQGERFTGRYMIDCGGPRAPLAAKFGLREDPCRYKTHSRSLYTHMVGVRPFDEIFKAKGQRWRWHEGTLHHMFHGGWLWVIPFNNHPWSTNELVSVGLQLDPRIYPKTDIPAQQEFDEFLARFPSIAAQFKQAKPVRDWVKTDRLQYSSTRAMGDRYCLMLHAAGFIDPLFSRGLENTAVTIHALAARLIKALRDDDFSPERFEYIERLQQALLAHNDDFVSCCYTAFSDFQLWDAFHRLWAVGTILGQFRLIQAHAKFQQTGDTAHLDHLDDDPPYLGYLCADMEGYHRLFNDAKAEVDAVAEKRRSAADAAANIHRMIDQADFARPLFSFGYCVTGAKRYVNHSKYSLLPAVRLFHWTQTAAPPEVKRYFDSPMLSLLKAYVEARVEMAMK